MPKVRSFPIPPTRLPFVNAEFARLERRGAVVLATSIWGGDGRGRLYLIDPATGACEARALPDGEPGAYMLRTGPDGRLYLGSGDGNLYRYDPSADRFETLVKGQMHSITWGGCVTERFVVWTASPGEACVYDWREARLVQVLKPFDPEQPAARYGHRVVETPDGKILVGMNVPQARLILLDPASGERKAFVPEDLRGKEWTRDATFLDSGRLALFCKDTLLLYAYPSFQRLARVPLSHDEKCKYARLAVCGGRLYALSDPEGSLWKLRPDFSDWELMRAGLLPMGSGILQALDERTLCLLEPSGLFLRVDTESGEVFSHELDATGPLGVHSFLPVPEIGRAFGGPFINQRFWEVDLARGEGWDLGRAAPFVGQINALAWDAPTRRLLLASYTTCTVTSYAPERPARFPENPRPLGRAGEEQMRPKALVHDGRFAWMASSAEYGHLGGALARIDPQSGEVRTWRHVVKDQTPNALVIDPARRWICLSTEIYADCESAPPTQDTARLAAFDMAGLQVVRELAPLKGCPRLKLLAPAGRGQVLVLAQGKLFLWEPDRGAFEDMGTSPQGLREVAAGPDGALYTSMQGQVGRLHLEGQSARFEPLAPGQGHFLRVAGGDLWYVEDQEVKALSLA